MSIKNSLSRNVIVLLTLSGLLFGAAGLAAQDRRAARSVSRFSISAGGGMGRTDDHRGVMEMNLGIRYRITSSLRAGLGFGYLKSGSHHGMDGEGRYGGRSSWSEGPAWNSGRRGEGPDFRIKSANLELVYAVPVGRKWDVSIGGGAGRYFGEFPGAREESRRGAWGGQGGLGAEFKFAARLTAFAEAGYRFLHFRDIPVQSPVVPLMMGPALDERLRPYTEWIARGMEMWMPQFAPQRTDLRLDGPVFRLGLRFGL